MDQKTLDLVLNSIESLRKGHKVLASKVIELSDRFKNTIEKIRKDESSRKLNLVQTFMS